MRNLINKLTIIAILIAITTMVSCFKESAIEPKAKFTTNLTDNTAYAGESFYMYLDETQGDFLTLFPGTSEGKTYSAEDGTRTGTTINTALDSFEVTLYNNMGEFEMTLVASSVGEFGEEYLQDVYTLPLTVKDKRTGFISFQIDKVEGVYNEDGTEIHFYTHKNADLTGKKPNFVPASATAVVTVNGVVQQPGKTVHDFTPAVAGSDESKTITYTVTASTGDATDYDVKYILRESNSDKELLSITAVGWGGTKFVLSSADQTSKSVKLFYESGALLSGAKMKADARAAAVIAKDAAGRDVDILPDDEKTDFVNYPTLTVVAEDNSTQEYDVLLYELESLSSFKFIRAGGSPLNPSVTGVFEGNTITLKVLTGTDLTSIVAEFDGLTNAVLKHNNSELTSGVTVSDFSAEPTLQVVHIDGTILKSYTLVIEELE